MKNKKHVELSLTGEEITAIFVLAFRTSKQMFHKKKININTTQIL